MKKVRLYEIAYARSGDKGDSSNVGVIAKNKKIYEYLKQHLTPETVKKHFEGIVQGEVERFLLPNINAINFILHNSLGGGGTLSLISDSQGKTHGQIMLMFEIEIPEELLKDE